MSEATAKQKNAEIKKLAQAALELMTNLYLPPAIHDQLGVALTDLMNLTEVFGDTDTKDILRWLPEAIREWERREQREAANANRVTIMTGNDRTPLFDGRLSEREERRLWQFVETLEMSVI